MNNGDGNVTDLHHHQHPTQEPNNGKDFHFQFWTAMDSLLSDGESSNHEATTVTYKVVACVIFCFMSFNFFFPYNSLFPLDRRTASAISGTLCYVTRAFLFPSQPMDLEGAVDWDVLVLLAAIMCINYIVVNQRETKDVVLYVQNKIKDTPNSGFWLVNLAAFLVSPFLTNDGVCLLFVEPILNAFECLNEPTLSSSGHGRDEENLFDPTSMQLEKSDAIYFLLGLACSSNIGSALTYTGNPQVCCSSPILHAALS